jgi:hypothetical protein
MRSMWLRRNLRRSTTVETSKAQRVKMVCAAPSSSTGSAGFTRDVRMPRSKTLSRAGSLSYIFRALNSHATTTGQEGPGGMASAKWRTRVRKAPGRVGGRSGSVRPIAVPVAAQSTRDRKVHSCVNPASDSSELHEPRVQSCLSTSAADPQSSCSIASNLEEHRHRPDDEQLSRTTNARVVTNLIVRNATAVPVDESTNFATDKQAAPLPFDQITHPSCARGASLIDDPSGPQHIFPATTFQPIRA